MVSGISPFAIGRVCYIHNSVHQLETAALLLLRYSPVLTYRVYGSAADEICLLYTNHPIQCCIYLYHGDGEMALVLVKQICVDCHSFLQREA
jgi:hypothetical protein